MYFLIALIFISKISLQFVPGIPYESSNIIYQYGFHPYVNIILCCAFGGIFVAKRFLKLEVPKAEQLKTFSFYIFLLSLYLFFITCLQVLFVRSMDTVTMQLTASFMSIATIYIFGKYLPTHIPASNFIKMIFEFASLLCWISLILLFVSPRTSFMGGRFIGVFKHIPHMVSVATLAYVAGLYMSFVVNQTRIKKIYLYLTMMNAVVLLVLTGTRSALASIMMATILSFILFKARSAAHHFLKVSILIFALLSGVLFGDNIVDYAVQVSRGEKSVGYRAAQDGVSSRWEEVLRGYDFFREEPWLGYGLLSKFGQTEDGSVGSYNASKDPHNLIISAGVVGGWGLIILVSVGFFGLLVLSILRLKSADEAIKLLAIYMVTQLPIIFIYHVHLSMGGIADRIYWIVIGYLAIKNRHD